MCNRYIYSFSYYSVPPTCTPFNPLPYTHTLAHTLCKPLPYSLHPHSLTAPPSPLTLTPLRMYFPHPSYPHPLTHSYPNPLTLPPSPLTPHSHLMHLFPKPSHTPSLTPHTLTLLCTSLTPHTLTLLHTSSPNPLTLSPHALSPEK